MSVGASYLGRAGVEGRRCVPLKKAPVAGHEVSYHARYNPNHWLKAAASRSARHSQNS